MQEHKPGLKSSRQQGCWSAPSKLPVRYSSGCRLPGSRGYLGRTDHCRPLVLAVQTWAEAEQASGHSLARPDLLRQFRRYLEQAVEKAKQEEAEGWLTAERKAALAAWQHKQKMLDSCAKKRLKQSAYLAAKTGFVEKAINRQTKLSQEEEDRRLQKHWQYWDKILWLAGCAPAAELRDYVAKPEQLVENREETAPAFPDQVPVWLKPAAGKVLQSRGQLQKAHAGSPA